MGAGRPDSGDPVLPELRLPRTRRVRRGSELRELFRRGKRGRTSHLDVFVSASPVSHPRLGVVVPRHRQKVVDRNLLKRRLREIGRTELLPRLVAAGKPVDLLIRARREAYGAEFGRLKEELVGFVEGVCSGR